jgi:hypothetical protein
LIRLVVIFLGGRQGEGWAHEALQPLASACAASQLDLMVRPPG